jgi:endogenous inhibitor of DNA gyrase (YacG/DUF329 family)
MKKEHITCPHCGKKNTWLPNNPARPFCSDRCKLIDLGEWAEEKYKIPVDPASSENDISSEDNESDES